jgi:LPS sulfotransferase NodH
VLKFPKLANKALKKQMRRFYFRHQVRPFVVLFIERDGSTYLVSTLGSHPDVHTVYERFAVMRQKGDGPEDQLDWARRYFTPPLIGTKAAVGFKTKLVDVLDHGGFVQVLQEKGVRIIHMQRRNRIKAVVSRINARRLYEKTGNWNLYKESDRMPPMTVDLDEFKSFVREREEADRVLAEYVAGLGLNTLTVCYEDMLQDRDAVFAGVFDFLNLRPWPVTSKTKKHTSDDLRDVIQNYDEVRAAFAGSDYENMFDEVQETPA